MSISCNWNYDKSQQTYRYSKSDKLFKLQRIINNNIDSDILIAEVKSKYDEMKLNNYDARFITSISYYLSSDIAFIPIKISECQKTFEYFKTLPKSHLYIFNNKSYIQDLNNAYSSIYEIKRSITDVLNWIEYHKTVDIISQDNIKALNLISIPVKYLIEWNHMLNNNKKYWEYISYDAYEIYILLYNNLKHNIVNLYEINNNWTNIVRDTYKQNWKSSISFMRHKSWLIRVCNEMKDTFKKLKLSPTWILSESLKNIGNLQTIFPKDIYNIVISYLDYL